ncbi:MAG: tetratricopeptide repeat protein [Breznakibacter sp.]
MHKFILYHILLLSILMFLSCKTQHSVSNEIDGQSTNQSLEDESLRKFNYFFYEANREKMLGDIEKSANFFIECLKLDPTSSASMYELSNLYILNKQYAKAQALMERAVALNPQNEWYLQMLANLYQQNNNNLKAIEILEKLTKTSSNNENYLYDLVLLLENEKKYDDALLKLDLLEEKVGLHDQLIIERQNILLDKGDKKKAFGELRKLVQQFPLETKYYGFLGDLHLYFKEFEQSKQQYFKMLQIDSTNHISYFSLSNLFIIQNDTSEFKSYLKKAVQSRYLDSSVKIQKLAPYIYTYSKGNKILLPDDIDFIFNTLIEIHPSDQNLYLIYGQLLRESGKKEKALAIQKRGIFIDEQNEQLWQDILFLESELNLVDDLAKDGLNAVKANEKNPLFYLFTASAFLQQNKPDSSIFLLDKGILFTDNNLALKSQYFALLGDSHYKEKNVDTAFYYYEEALKLNDKNLVVLNNYSYFLSLEGKDLEKAEKMSSKCVEFEPGNSTYLDTYAWILFKRQRYFEAKFIIERALDNGGDKNGVIVEHFGDILFFNGDTNGAVDQWNKAKELGVENVDKLQKKISDRKFID